jgi:polysaccharide export outer membrane protein
MVLFRMVVMGLLCLAVAAPARGIEPSYRIGPGDELEISVWKDESLSRRLTVPPDGVVSFPLIDDIDVNRLTVADLREIARKRLSEYVPDATVSVILLESKSMRGFVVGKVRKPGSYGIGMETTVMQLLSMAGGLDPFAQEDGIQILRQINNQTIKIPFNYGEVSEGEKLGQNIVLQRGDVVVVP